MADPGEKIWFPASSHGRLGFPGDLEGWAALSLYLGFAVGVSPFPAAWNWGPSAGSWAGPSWPTCGSAPNKEPPPAPALEQRGVMRPGGWSGRART